MLEYLRNASEKLVAKLFIAILAFSFVGWGVAEWIFGASVNDNVVMSVGNADVSAQQFNAQRSRALAQMDREAQRKLYADNESQNAFSKQILSELVTQQMAENRAHDLGFVVTDKRIANQIRELSDFQDNGKFSAQKFDAVLANAGYSEADFADVLRSDTLRSMVLGAIDVPVAVPEFVVKANFNARYAKRDVDYVTVKLSDFKIDNPTDEQLKQFYAQRPHVVPETRSVSYVFIPAEMSQPDKYDAGYAIAIKVEDDIIAGETMRDVAKKHGAKFVELKAFDREHRPADKNLTDSMIATIFDMDEGLESEMIETKDGFLFVRVDKINKAHNAEFDSVKKSLVADWIHAEQEKQAYVRANEILMGLKQDGTFKGKKSASVSRTSGAPNDVLVAAFANNVGEKMIVPSSDAFYVVDITKATLPDADAKKSASLRKESENMSKTFVTDDYNSFLMREYPTKVNEKVYNRLFLK